MLELKQTPLASGPTIEARYTWHLSRPPIDTPSTERRCLRARSEVPLRASARSAKVVDRGIRRASRDRPDGDAATRIRNSKAE